MDGLHQRARRRRSSTGLPCRKGEGARLQVLVDLRCDVVQSSFPRRRTSVRRPRPLSAQTEFRASAGPAVVPKFSSWSASPRWLGAIVDQNHAARAVHFRVRRLAEELRVLGVDLAREDALLVVFLRLVPQDQDQLVLYVDTGVVVVVVLAGGDAISGENNADPTPWRARRS